MAIHTPSVPKSFRTFPPRSSDRITMLSPSGVGTVDGGERWVGAELMLLEGSLSLMCIEEMRQAGLEESAQARRAVIDVGESAGRRVNSILHRLCELRDSGLHI